MLRVQSITTSLRIMPKSLFNSLSRIRGFNRCNGHTYKCYLVRSYLHYCGKDVRGIKMDMNEVEFRKQIFRKYSNVPHMRALLKTKKPLKVLVKKGIPISTL